MYDMEMMLRRASMRRKNGLEDNIDFIYDKLGDALSYAMTAELPELAKNHGDGDAPHFYAVLSYLYLNNWVSNNTASRAYMIMNLESNGEDSIKKVIKKVSKFLLKSLRNKVEFRDFSELIVKLNQHSISRWYFYIGKQLIHNSELDAYLYNGMLYYIGPNKAENDKALLRIPIMEINFETDLLDDEYSKVLVDGFQHILAFDEKHKHVYLKMYNQENCFAYYDILNDKLVICRNRFLALIDGMLWIITDDKYVALVMGDSIHRIKKYREGEIYDGRNDCFFVHPSVGRKIFFYPFYLFFDGHIELADKKDYGKILWKFISKSVIENQSNSLAMCGLNTDSVKKCVMPVDFSINQIIESLNNVIPREERCTNVDYVRLENIFDMLKKYCDPDKDYTKLWFTLGEANTYLNREGIFPSDELYWRLKEIERENGSGETSLSALLQNDKYDQLFVELLKEKKYGYRLDLDNCVGKDKDEEIALLFEDEFDKKTSCMIGIFIDVEGDIDIQTMMLEEGMFVGSQIIPKVDFSKASGVVTYDAHLKRSYVICENDLTMNDRLMIIRKFNLNENRVTFVLQRK